MTTDGENSAGAPRPVPDVMLDRLLAGDLSPEQQATIEAACAASPELAARLAERRAERQAFYAADPPAGFAHRVAVRLAHDEAQTQARKRPWWAYFAAPSLAAAAALVVAVTYSQIQEPDPLVLPAATPMESADGAAEAEPIAADETTAPGGEAPATAALQEEEAAGEAAELGTLAASPEPAAPPPMEAAKASGRREAAGPRADAGKKERKAGKGKAASAPHPEPKASPATRGRGGASKGGYDYGGGGGSRAKPKKKPKRAMGKRRPRSSAPADDGPSVGRPAPAPAKAAPAQPPPPPEEPAAESAPPKRTGPVAGSATHRELDRTVVPETEAPVGEAVADEPAPSSAAGGGAFAGDDLADEDAAPMALDVPFAPAAAEKTRSPAPVDLKTGLRVRRTGGWQALTGVAGAGDEISVSVHASAAGYVAAIALDSGGGRTTMLPDGSRLRAGVARASTGVRFTQPGRYRVYVLFASERFSTSATLRGVKGAPARLPFAGEQRVLTLNVE